MPTRMISRQDKVRLAVQEVHKEFSRYPLRFLTEADVQCALYAALKKRFRASYRFDTYPTGNGWTERLEGPQVMTGLVHAEFPMYGADGANNERVDLCVLSKGGAKFYVGATIWDPSEGRYFLRDWDWSKDEDMIGIEIKLNHKATKSGSKAFERLAASCRGDLRKLLGYTQGWFILVDPNSVFVTAAQWKRFFEAQLRKVTERDDLRGARNIRGYYLSPNRRRAWITKAYWRS